MNDILKVVVGFDQRESIAYHTFTQSIIEKCSMPLIIIPLAMNTLKGYKETHTDKSNDFILVRPNLFSSFRK